MNKDFKRLVDQLPAKCEKLTTSDPVKVSSLPRDLPEKGIYVFYEVGRPLYVGRTNSMRRRLQHHSRPSAKDAPLAFRIAREEADRLKAAYKPEGSRPNLLSTPEFAKAYQKAKARVQEMDIRFVEETNQVAQALLEIYAVFELNARYNDFDTH